MTLEDVYRLYVEQDKRCVKTKRKIILFASDAERKKRLAKVREGCLDRGPLCGIENEVSVDRIDSLKGYTSDNVQLVTAEVNIAKNAMSDDAFFKLCCEHVASDFVAFVDHIESLPVEQKRSLGIDHLKLWGNELLKIVPDEEAKIG